MRIPETSTVNVVSVSAVKHGHSTDSMHNSVPGKITPWAAERSLGDDGAVIGTADAPPDTPEGSTRQAADHQLLLASRVVAPCSTYTKNAKVEVLCAPRN